MMSSSRILIYLLGIQSICTVIVVECNVASLQPVMVRGRFPKQRPVGGLSPRGQPVAMAAFGVKPSEWANEALSGLKLNIDKLKKQNKPLEKEVVDRMEFVDRAEFEDAPYDFLEQMGHLLSEEQRREYDENGSCNILGSDHLLCTTCCETKGQAAVAGDQGQCSCVFQMSEAGLDQETKARVFDCQKHQFGSVECGFCCGTKMMKPLPSVFNLQCVCGRPE